jgi:hypothetical protein
MGVTTLPLSETWKPVLGFEAIYEVSDLGRVRRIGKACGAAQGNVLKGGLDKDGYPRVGLCNAPKPRVYKYVHVLVLEAFKGPCPAGQEACHGDGKRNNSVLSNLRWDTPANNIADRERHGTTVRGERSLQAKLTEPEVRQIKVRLSAGESARGLARAYGMSKRAIQSIKSGRCWSHVA